MVSAHETDIQIGENVAGDIWSAAQPVFYRSFNFRHSFGGGNASNLKVNSAPSHVLRVRFQAGLFITPHSDANKAQ